MAKKAKKVEPKKPEPKKPEPKKAKAKMVAHTKHEAKESKEAPKPAAPPKPKAPPAPPTYELPGYFVNRYAADMIDLVARANDSGETESTVCQVEIVGSGNVGAITVYSDGKRVWSPDNANIESWLGYLKPHV